MQKDRGAIFNYEEFFKRNSSYSSSKTQSEIDQNARLLKESTSKNRCPQCDGNKRCNGGYCPKCGGVGDLPRPDLVCI